MWVSKGEFVHFQWTGSNTNPNNNAGQGTQGTDRSNMIILRNNPPMYQVDATVYQIDGSIPTAAQLVQPLDTCPPLASAPAGTQVHARFAPVLFRFETIWLVDSTVCLGPTGRAMRFPR